MASRTTKTKDALSRVFNLFKVFVRNKRGLLGLIIIFFFVFMAILAPYLTPYQPLQPYLSGSYAAPIWLKYLPTFLGGDPTLSENLEAIKSTSFSQGVIDGWALTKDSTHISDLQVEKGIAQSTYSLAITFDREETGVGALTGTSNASVYYDFYYPYQGPPYRYMGDVGIFVNGTSFSSTITNSSISPNGTLIISTITVQSLYVVPRVNIFIEKLPNGPKWEIYPDPVSAGTWWEWNSGNKTNYNAVPLATTGWLKGSADSLTLYDAPQKFPGLFPGTVDGSTVCERTFAGSPGYYRFGLDISFADVSNSTIPVQTTVYVGSASFSCEGKAWGLLGTDNYGEDLWTQLVYGSRVSLVVGLVSAAIGVGLGLIVGLAAGFLGSAVDEVLMRFTDLLLVIPFLPLMMVLVEILGAGIENLILIIGFLGWMGFARVIRSQVLSLKERPFVEAAKSVGAGRTHIIVRHIMPNVMALVYVTLASSVPGAITLEASLAFLGFSDPFLVSWGKMLNGAFFIGGSMSWWWVIFPGLCIAVLAMAFILVGFALDEIMNPRLRLRR
jgi:peptide/nickel transport system permease protein